MEKTNVEEKETISKAYIGRVKKHKEKNVSIIQRKAPLPDLHVLCESHLIFKVTQSKPVPSSPFTARKSEPKEEKKMFVKLRRKPH